MIFSNFVCEKCREELYYSDPALTVCYACREIERMRVLGPMTYDEEAYIRHVILENVQPIFRAHHQPAKGGDAT